MKQKRVTSCKLAVAILCFIAAPFAAGVGTGGTGLKAYVQGALAPVAGVVVNGITFDASQAAITINGRSGPGANQLQPGMVAGIDATVFPGTQIGVAKSIVVARTLFGRVVQVGTGGTGLKVVGISVVPRADVVFAGFTSIGEIAVDDTLDVYGYSDGISGTVYATRIERVPAADDVELHGVVAALATNTFIVQGVTIDYSDAQIVGFSGSFANGDRVVVRGTASGQGIVANTVSAEPAVETDNGEEAEVEDSVAALIAPSIFVAGAFEVDATHASFTGGTAADLAVGRVVHVHGRIVHGVLMATTIEFDDSATDDAVAGASEPQGPITSTTSPTSFAAESAEVEGTVDAVTTSGFFVVRGMLIDARAAQVTDGSLADVAVGTKVRAIGISQEGVLVANLLEIDW